PVAHLQQRTLPGASFERAPALYYRPSTPIPSWWQSLNSHVIDQLLSDVGIKQAGALRLDCINTLNRGTRLPGEPWIVASGATLRTTPPPGSGAIAPNYQRKLGRTQPITIPPLANDPLTAADFTPPAHDTPLKYSVLSPGFASGATDVLVLANFGCHGTAHIPT